MIVSKFFDCDKCGNPDKGKGIGGWSVDSELWNEIMKGNEKRVLCIDCFENILGRKLNKADFTDTMDNETSSVVKKYFL